MKLEDLLFRLKIEEDNKNSKKKLRKSSTIIGLILLKKLLPKKKREKSLIGRSYNRPRRKSKATVTTVARLVIGLLIVVLQERTKTKAKEKVKQTSWRIWKM